MSTLTPKAPKKSKPKRVVAELGRPETDEETAARKAENSRNYRMRKTVNNLVLSTMACVGLVIIIVLAVPRSNESMLPHIDYASVVAEAQPAYEQVLVNPELPKDWWSNYAEIRKANSVTSWNIGLQTPEGAFIAVTQGFDANDTWQAQLLKNTVADGTRNIAGIDWTYYDNRDADPKVVGNVRYALTTQVGNTYYVLHGGASEDEFVIAATALSENIRAEAAR